MAKHYTFTVRLEPGKPGSTHQVVAILTKEQSARLGMRTRVDIAGTLGGQPFRNSLFPTGDGRHFMVVSRALREAAGVDVGAKVKVTLAVETGLRAVDVPAELEAALAESAAAQAAFEALSYSQKKLIVDDIAGAKGTETRARRVAKAVADLGAQAGGGLPADFTRALAQSKAAKAAFDKIPPSHRREYLGYINEAKRPETRARRIEQAIARLAQPGKETKP